MGRHHRHHKCKHNSHCHEEEDCSKPQETNDWPSFNHDIKGTRNASGPSDLSVYTAGGLHEIWDSVAIDGIPLAETASVGVPPIIVGQVVYYVDTAGFMFARNVATGAIIWKTLLGGLGQTGVTYANDTLWTATSGGPNKLFAVDLAGNIKPGFPVDIEPVSYSLADSIINSGIVVIPEDDLVLVPLAANGEWCDCNPVFQGRLVAYDMAGKHRWSYLTATGSERGCGIWGTPSVDVKAKRIFVATANSPIRPAGKYSDSILCLDYSKCTPKLVWSHQFTSQDSSNFRFQNGPNYDVVGSILFEAKIDGCFRKLISVRDKAGRESVLDRNTGKKIWNQYIVSANPTTFGCPASAYANGQIFSLCTFEPPLLPNGTSGVISGAGVVGSFCAVNPVDLERMKDSFIYGRNNISVFDATSGSPVVLSPQESLPNICPDPGLYTSTTFGSITHAYGLLITTDAGGHLRVFNATDLSTIYDNGNSPVTPPADPAAQVWVNLPIFAGAAVSGNYVLFGYGSYFFSNAFYGDSGGGVKMFSI